MSCAALSPLNIATPARRPTQIAVDGIVAMLPGVAAAALLPVPAPALAPGHGCSRRSSSLEAEAQWSVYGRSDEERAELRRALQRASPAAVMAQQLAQGAMRRASLQPQESALLHLRRKREAGCPSISVVSVSSADVPSGLHAFADWLEMGKIGANPVDMHPPRTH